MFDNEDFSPKQLGRTLGFEVNTVAKLCNETNNVCHMMHIGPKRPFPLSLH